MIIVRKAKHNDVERILDLWCEFMDFHEQYDSIYKRAKNGHSKFANFLTERISDRNSLVIVAIAENSICGYLLAKIDTRPPVFKDRKHLVIFDLAVKEKFRRKGIGEELFHQSVKWSEKKNITRVELDVATSNPISMKFWTKMGFKPYSERRYLNIAS